MFYPESEHFSIPDPRSYIKRVFRKNKNYGTFFLAPFGFRSNSQQDNSSRTPQKNLSRIRIPGVTKDFGKVFISHPFFVSRNTKQNETKNCFAQFRLFRKTETQRNFVPFRFVSSKVKFRFVSNFFLVSFRESYVPLLRFICFFRISESVKYLLLHFNACLILLNDLPGKSDSLREPLQM
jgi:hypothetical protein